MTFLLLLYLSVQTFQLVLYKENAFFVSQTDGFFNGEDFISGDINFAFALSSYDGETGIIEDPTYITLTAEYRVWG